MPFANAYAQHEDRDTTALSPPRVHDRHRASSTTAIANIHDPNRAIPNFSNLYISHISYDQDKPDRVNHLVLLNTIVNDRPEREYTSLAAHRTRARSRTVRAISPYPPGSVRHSRASSEHTHRYTEKQFRRHGERSATGFRGRRSNTDLSMNGSFFLEESGSEGGSSGSSRSSSTNDPDRAGDSDDDDAAATLLSSPACEQILTFDELVDRLLDQPLSKADHKFAAVFLALYRKFAAPGRLLEAIVERFDALERNDRALMIKTVAQLRYVAILEQWVRMYPGDFAYPKTKRRLHTFAAKLADTRIFAVAAKEFIADIEAVHENDDTHWAYSDRERESSTSFARSSVSSSASTLIDDPSYLFGEHRRGSTIDGDGQLDAATEETSSFNSHVLARVESAQREALLMQPLVSHPITKVQWRKLIEQPDDLIARELTRMDWIMFSAIRPRDLVRHISTARDTKGSFRNWSHVNRMVEHFNQLALWVSNYILLRDKAKHRALMLEKFMRIARKLREMNNYNALGALIAGVSSTAIHRLAATRDLIPPSIGRDWLKLEVLMNASKSHATYRLAWENSSGERIPYLPLLQRDLASAEEGNATFVGSELDDRINWRKFEIMGDVVLSVQRAQETPYRDIGGSKGNELIRELILDVQLVKDDEALYERSVQCEPTGAVGGPSASTSAKFMDFFKR